MTLSHAMPHFIEGISLFLLLLSFGGLAWTLDRRFDRRLCDFAASGFLLFLLTFVLCRWFGFGPRLTSFVIGMCTLAGLVGFTLQFQREPHTAAKSLGLATLFAMIYALAWFVPVNPGAVDPKHYAMNAAWAMQDDWFWANLDAFDLKNHAKTLFLHDCARRLGCGALSFTHNPLHLAIDLGTIQRGQVFMLANTGFVAFGAFFRHGTGQPFLRAGFALLCTLIVLGNHHLVSSLIGGQVNQTLAVLLFTIVLSDLWQYLETGETPWRSMASCLLLPGIYPEAVWVIPFIFLTSLGIVSRFHSKRIWVALILGITCVSLGIIYHGRIFMEYLINQSAAKPGWYPLENYKSTVLETFSVIACGVNPKVGKVLLALLAILTGSALWFARREQTSQRLFRVLFPVGIVGAMTCFIMLAISKTGNENYAVFKMAGWLCPLIAFALYGLGIAALRSPWPLWWRSLTLLVVFGMAGTSWIGSLNLLGDFPLREQQPSVRFVGPPPAAELKIGGLYDPVWVAELAPWRNIALRNKNTE